MKAKIDDEIEILAEMPANFGDRLIPKGTRGIVVECYLQPEGYAVDLAVPQPALVGGFDFENVILTPDQFVLVRQSDWMVERSRT